jgi:hypothetical protein
MLTGRIQMRRWAAGYYDILLVSLLAHRVPGLAEIVRNTSQGQMRFSLT